MPWTCLVRRNLAEPGKAKTIIIRIIYVNGENKHPASFEETVQRLSESPAIFQH